MKSVTSSVARNYRLQEWAAQIRECQNRLPGTSVKEWCGQHDVTVANYYYRFAKCVRPVYKTFQKSPVHKALFRFHQT